MAETRTARSDGRSLCVAANTPAGTPTASAISIDSRASSSVSGKRCEDDFEHRLAVGRRDAEVALEQARATSASIARAIGWSMPKYAASAARCCGVSSPASVPSIAVMASPGTSRMAKKTRRKHRAGQAERSRAAVSDSSSSALPRQHWPGPGCFRQSSWRFGSAPCRLALDGDLGEANSEPVGDRAQSPARSSAAPCSYRM